MTTKMFDLKGKVAIVTGGNGGIGLGIARGLAEAGADIAVVGRNEAKSKAAASELTARGVKAIAVVADVTDQAAVASMVERVRRELGRIDILINNAGIATASGRTHEFSIADWDRLMAINLRGVFLTTRKALQSMLPGPGSIINIASVAALRGYYPGFVSLQVNYSTAKAGIVGFTRQVAAEYAKEKIRVNAIAPGWHGGTALAAERRAVSTPEQMEQFEKALRERIPMKHRGVPDDLVGLAVYLASDASHYVTGQVIAHDGGWDAAIV
jgi:gluconate 5-dehydrogenase